MRRSALAAALLVAWVSPAAGQSAIYGAGLQAWLGCWSGGPGSAREAMPPIVCITPTARADVADLLTVEDDRIVARETLDATGRSRPITAARCTGVRTGTWSRDGRRLFVRSAGVCAGVRSSTSGLLAMTTDGDWLDVEGISAGGGTSVRVARYRPVTPPALLPLATRSTLRAQALATQSVRVAAAAPVREEDVLEAKRAVDSAVVEAWLHAVSRAAVVVRGAEEHDDGVSRTTMADEWYAMPLGWGWGYALPGGRSGSGYRDPRYGTPRQASPPPPAEVTLRLGKPRR